VSPAHHSHERRWPVLAIVVAVVAGVGIVAATRSTPAPVGASTGPASVVGAPDAESSAWYCTGQSTASGGVSPGFLALTNTSTRSVGATITAVSDGGATARVALTVPPRNVAAPNVPPLASGSWEAETVTVSGGGIAVTQLVHSSLGWSESPCQSTTSSLWYFAGGSTAAADGLDVSVLNPTSTPVVVDLSFVTRSGTVHPINYQGIVLQPGQVAVEDVASEVQQQQTVSTVVATRTGRVVASELQQFVGASAGESLVPGVPVPESRWAIPQAQEVPGGASEVDVFNPGTTPEEVTVRLRLPSGPLAPLSDAVAPGTTWALQTSAQTRIPDNVTYAATVDARGGPGVVVGRTVNLPGSAASPQAGMAVAVAGSGATSPSGMWVVPPPGTAGSSPASGAAPAYLALLNTSDTDEHFVAFGRSGSGAHTLATGTLGADSATVVYGSALAAARLDQVVVRSDGPMAISEDANPSGGIGVVTMPGIPLAAPIGL
jgi:Family of unknown function (DUF5719)